MLKSELEEKLAKSVKAGEELVKDNRALRARVAELEQQMEGWENLHDELVRVKDQTIRDRYTIQGVLLDAIERQARGASWSGTAAGHVDGAAR